MALEVAERFLDLHALSVFFQWAMRRNLAMENPVKRVPIPSDVDAVRFLHNSSKHGSRPAEHRHRSHRLKPVHAFPAAFQRDVACSQRRVAVDRKVHCGYGVGQHVRHPVEERPDRDLDEVSAEHNGYDRDQQKYMRPFVFLPVLPAARAESFETSTRETHAMPVQNHRDTHRQQRGQKLVDVAIVQLRHGLRNVLS